MSRLLPLLLLVLVALAANSQPARAAEPVLIDQKVETPDKLTVGDPFRYVISVEADAGTNVFLAPGGLPATIELTSTPSTSSRPLSNGRVQSTITLNVAAFVPGEVTIEPLQLRYRTREGATGDLRTQPATISVISVLPEGGNLDPRDLKPQAEIGTPPATWFYYATGVAVLALILVLALLLWRRRVLARRAAYVAPEPDPEPLTPEDKARGELDQAGREFASAGGYGRYYGTIGVTVRQYLTARYGFGAFALTTVELQDQMQRLGLDRWQARLVSGLLTQCDSAVYAGYQPAHERADADLTAAYEIVEMSRPQPALVEVSST